MQPISSPKNDGSSSSIYPPSGSKVVCPTRRIIPLTESSTSSQAVAQLQRSNFRSIANPARSVPHALQPHALLRDTQLPPTLHRSFSAPAILTTLKFQRLRIHLKPYINNRSKETVPSYQHSLNLLLLIYKNLSGFIVLNYFRKCACSSTLPRPNPIEIGAFIHVIKHLAEIT